MANSLFHLINSECLCRTALYLAPNGHLALSGTTARNLLCMLALGAKPRCECYRSFLLWVQATQAGVTWPPRNGRVSAASKKQWCDVVTIFPVQLRAAFKKHQARRSGLPVHQPVSNLRRVLYPTSEE